MRLVFLQRAWFRCAGFLGAGVMVAGCASSSGRDAAETVAREAFQHEADRVRKSASQVGDISSQGATLAGQDEQGRFLWSIGFKTGRVSEEQTDKEGKVTVPRRGDLRDARATLYRNGVPSTSLRASRLVFTETPRGLMMTLSEGVHARSSDLWAPNENASGTNASGAKNKSGANSKSAKSALSKAPRAQSNGAKSTGAKAAQRGPVLLQAPRLDVDVSARRLVASNGVELIQDQTHITGQRLNADSELAVANLQGQVRARDPQGTMSADAAVWNWRAGRALATGHVAISHDGTTLSGARLDADTHLARGTLSGGATSTKSSPNADSASSDLVRAVSANGQAQASQLLYNWKTGRLSARGRVTLQKDGGTLSAARLDSDDKLRVATAQGSVSLRKDDATLTATHITAFDKLARVEASGGVLLVRPDGRLSAENAVVWIGEKRAQASGGVSLVRSDMTVRASRAQVTNAGNRDTAQVVASGDVTLIRDGATTRAQNVRVTNAGNRATAQVTAWGDVRMARGDVSMRAARVETAPGNGRQIVTATGGVVARNKSGAVRANQVVWHEGATSDNGRVVATGDVALQKDGSTLRGGRLESDTGFRLATLSGAVGGSLKQNGSATMTISAPRLQATNWRNAARARIVASGGVAARRGNLSLRGDDLQATGNGDHAILTGHVLVRSDDGATVRAPYVRYEKAENKVYASGGVVVNDPKHGTQHGRTLVADLNLKKATLTDVTGTFNQELFKKKIFGD